MAATRRLSEILDRLSSLVELPGGALVVALSGGADSAALAYLASESRDDVRLLHVDHGFEHSAQMRESATLIADRIGADLEVVGVEVASGPSVEGQARSARYEAFATAVPEPAALLTGHTKDDQAETVLMNMLRGSGLRGVSGIPPFRPPNIYRPLLDVSRSETREIGALAGLHYRDDPMNLDPRLRRNVVRLEVLPSLRRFNPKLTESLARLAVSARLDSEFLEKEVRGLGIVEASQSVRVSVGALLAAEPVVAGRGIASMVRSVRGEGPTLDEMNRVRRVVQGASRSVQLTPGITVRREGPMLVMASRPALEERVTLTLTEGSHRLGRFTLDVEKRDGVCRVAPLGARSAIFAPSVALTATAKSGNEIVVSADGREAWGVGVRRHPVAYYEPGSNGYLSVIATEESDQWTSSL